MRECCCLENEKRIELPPQEKNKDRKNYYLRKNYWLYWVAMSSVRKYIVSGSILFIISVFFFSYYVGPTVISYLENPYYPCYKILLPVNVAIAIPNRPYDLNFRYYPANVSLVPPTPDEIWVSDSVTGNAQYFDATVGATYSWEGTEFKVSDVHPVSATILVKPET